MKNISVHDAKTNLSKYIEAAKRGEQVHIGRFGRAEVALTALAAKSTSSKRQFGVPKSKIMAGPDAFTPATDKAVARLLLGNDS